MFSEINEKNRKKKASINAKIEKAEGKIKDLENKLSTDMDMEEYSDIAIKIESYKKFIAANREEIVKINKNPFTREQLEGIRDRIINTYNPKLSKAYSKLSNKINDVVSAYEEYEKVTNEFLRDRNQLNLNAPRIGEVCSVYDGDGIKKDVYKRFENDIDRLKTTLELCNKAIELSNKAI